MTINLEKIYKEERCILVHDFRFQSMICGLHCCEPVVRQKIMVTKVYGRAKLLISQLPGSKEGETRRGQGQASLPSGPLPPTRPPFPQFHCLPTVYGDFEAITGLTYGCRQIAYDPVSS
jgi:hypothetical protein